MIYYLHVNSVSSEVTNSTLHCLLNSRQLFI